MAPAGLGWLYWVFHPAEEAAEESEEGVHRCTLETFEKNRLRWHHKGYCRPMFIGKYLGIESQDSLLPVGNTNPLLQRLLEDNDAARHAGLNQGCQLQHNL